ncbi:MAG: FAD-dependent oxidoreductase [Erythrobacter sp.]|uniref:FAD-dependent oxidoreductase n=1 Tax=Erythrobacter sp. TaxID=1042 RepID=UPI001B1C51D9|nr:FAD-dependent oxidoreductase [Erythrobacter sp.]MBO6766859.1 FAD-dependent oxidoreductase [Erythrobacter sp.]
MATAGPDLVLIGGGHAHLGVLADWVRNGRPGGRTLLLSPHRHARYSGMIPGTAAGEYALDDGLTDLAALVRLAGAELVLDRCAAIDPDQRIITTETGRQIPYDLCSIDTGGVGQARKILGDDPRILDVRPIGDFLVRLDQRIDGASGKVSHIVAVGGGAGGVELAFALHRRFESIGARVTLVAGEPGLLPGFSRRARALARRAMARKGIELFEDDARFEDGRFMVGDQSIEPVDLVVASLGGGAPAWPGASGIAVTEDGFVAVDRHQRSLSHPHIFAAGDVAQRQDITVPRSGVHAVHTGPVLASNLRRTIVGKDGLQSYRPRPASLYLISTADGKAIASYGPFAAHGRWAGRLKGWIDNRWVASFAKLAHTV